MADIALVWQPDQGGADMAIVDDDLASEEGLRTAVELSLFLDRRANDDDTLPSEDGDRRGWWGDEFAQVEGDRIGSRRWLLDRSKRRIPDVVRDLEAYDREALQWMIDDLVAEKVDVAVSIQDGMLVDEISIWRPGAKDPATFRFSHVWEGEAARAV